MNINLGQDIGILSQDDTPAKKFASGGISTISTNFTNMAQRAAEFVHNRVPVQEVTNSTFVRRASL